LNLDFPDERTCLINAIKRIKKIRRIMVQDKKHDDSDWHEKEKTATDFCGGRKKREIVFMQYL